MDNYNNAIINSNEMLADIDGNTTHIDTLEDIIRARHWENQDVGKITMRIRERLTSNMREGAAFSLTGLQKMAVNHPQFWNSQEEYPSHLIIQGATSAGKTLLSELMILDEIHNGQNQVIVLVPLKAMVRERMTKFKADIESVNPNYTVYGSSSDYLDNDERIISGDYKIAIIVYEKFFAILNQTDCRILNGCSLIVVDELSMVGKEERGPKLEMSLEIARNKNALIRIVCLATSDCKTTYIAKWLGRGGQNATIIGTQERPIGLDEFILLPNGQGKHRHIIGENDATLPHLLTATDSSDSDVKIDIPGYNENDKKDLKKKKWLLAIVKKVFQEYDNAKVLIFVANKTATLAYAKYLAQSAGDIFTFGHLDTYFEEKIGACDQDEDRDELKNNLLPHGIAYHNAGISTNLRELIEEEFQRNNSPIKAIVATETLTIGVNMPFDVMIMLDYEVPHGDGP